MIDDGPQSEGRYDELATRPINDYTALFSKLKLPFNFVQFRIQRRFPKTPAEVVDAS